MAHYHTLRSFTFTDTLTKCSQHGTHTVLTSTRSIPWLIFWRERNVLLANNKTPNNGLKVNDPWTQQPLPTHLPLSLPICTPSRECLTFTLRNKLVTGDCRLTPFLQRHPVTLTAPTRTRNMNVRSMMSTHPALFVWTCVIYVKCNGQR